VDWTQAGSPARREFVLPVVPEGLEAVDCVKLLPLESLSDVKDVLTKVEHICRSLVLETIGASRRPMD